MSLGFEQSQPKKNPSVSIIRTTDDPSCWTCWGSIPMELSPLFIISIVPHCKCFDHKNYGDWKLRGPCRENLHYLWKRAVRIAGNPHDNYRTYNYHGISLQFLQPFSIDSADFPCRDPAIFSPRSFYGQNICSVVNKKRGMAGMYRTKTKLAAFFIRTIIKANYESK